LKDFMAGHSKWANIQHRKGRQDEKRGQDLDQDHPRNHGSRQDAGGGDINFNPRLRVAVDKAKAANMPKPTRSSTTSRRPPANSKASSTKKSATKATASAARPSWSTP
jgi:transcriptional/translational regulatory protein YebC/TACO1